MMIAQQMVALYTNGGSLHQVARQFGMGTKKARSILTAMGMEIRSWGGSYGRGDTRPKCAQCKVILEEAPPGHDGICGWCEDDRWKKEHRLRVDW